MASDDSYQVAILHRRLVGGCMQSVWLVWLTSELSGQAGSGCGKELCAGSQDVLRLEPGRPSTAVEVVARNRATGGQMRLVNWCIRGDDLGMTWGSGMGTVWLSDATL